jgi:hypothetical protein
VAGARRASQRSAAQKHGWRSGLEDTIGAQLDAAGIPYEYETLKIPFTQPVKPRRYTPDFVLPNGIIIESKGRFETADRQKHIYVQQQHPDLDIRFVFSNANQRISKQSKTTYAAWCVAKGFLYDSKLIPVAWLREPVNKRSLRAVRQLMEST